MRRTAESLTPLAAALAPSEKVHGADSLVRARLLHDRARGQGELGQREAALATLREALALVEKVAGPEHPAVKLYVNTLGEQAFHLRTYPEARAAFERVLRLSETVDGPGSAGVAGASTTSRSSRPTRATSRRPRPTIAAHSSSRSDGSAPSTRRSPTG